MVGYYRAGRRRRRVRAGHPGPARSTRGRAPSNVGPFATPWGGGAPGARDVPVAGLGGVPANAVAVVLNVTVVNPTDRLLPAALADGQRASRRTGRASTSPPGQIVPNAVTVKLGTGGKVRVLNAEGSVDVVIDVTGYYTAVGGGRVPPGAARSPRSTPAPASNVGPFATPLGPGVACGPCRSPVGAACPATPRAPCSTSPRWRPRR